MRPADIQITNTLKLSLNNFQGILPMPGIANPATLDCFVKQMVDSVRRVRYVSVISNKNHNSSVCNPHTDSFDPIKAAAWFRQNGDYDEAAWLVFLATHFGKNKQTKWQLVKNVYGALGHKAPWTWNSIKANVPGFRSWLHLNEVTVKSNANFGNHRKYTSINALQNNGTGAAVESYISWILSNKTHTQLFTDALFRSNNNGRLAFAELYKQMSVVNGFGRTGRFDYLTMIGKLTLANIEPDSTYMHGATGPYAGATLLFGVKKDRKIFNQWLDALETHLGLYFGMQVLEDALCNWQKSPSKYVYFGG